jgi:L-2-hydroxyglutarate oxidase LhgO
MTSERIAVIGAGIIGLAVARQLGQARPGTELTVIDKEIKVGAHQSSHNSGVVHVGVYYAPDSLKAILCRRGSLLLREYCADRGIAFDECGKLVIASGNSELEALSRIRERAEQNRVVGLRRVGPEEIRDIEPHATGIAGLYSPRTAITDFPAVARSFAEDVVAAGGHLLLGNPVKEISPRSTGVAVRIGEDEMVFDRVVICAGLQSDAVAKQAGDEAEPAIIPFRGEYYRLIPSKNDLVKGLIYPLHPTHRWRSRCGTQCRIGIRTGGLPSTRSIPEGFVGNTALAWVPKDGTETLEDGYIRDGRVHKQTPISRSSPHLRPRTSRCRRCARRVRSSCSGG